MAHPTVTPTTAPPSTEDGFQPYVPDEANVPEFTLRAVLFGAFFGIVFGAVTVYLALRAGLTVSASIPIAVLSIAILKRFGSTILENNIVQTAGSAGESVAAGVVFTLPALIFLGFGLDIGKIFWVALAGGILGVLFMIPLRRQLIVKEHHNLLYPEGTACADVLIAGEKGGSFAGRVFAGFGVAAVYKFLHEGLRLWSGQPAYQPGWYPGGTLAGTTTPEYLGVGYIIGIRVGGVIFAGGVLSWLVLIPMIKFFGASIPGAVFPGTIPIAEMSPGQVWAAYIRPIGAGAVTAAGLFTLARTLPTIVSAFRAGFADLTSERGGSEGPRRRTENDMSMTTVLAGSGILAVGIWALLTFSINPGYAGANLIAAVLIVIFGFLFVTVSSRIVGIIGSSANPISGMTIATLMATSLIFLSVGWVGGAWAAVALMVGAVVCIAAANAGATSQDLKTGYLVGATPRYQQIALVIGVLASVAVIGWTLTYLNKAYTVIDRVEVEQVTVGPEMRVIGDITYADRQYQVLNVIGSRTIPDGRYYYDPAARRIEWQEAPGIGSADMPAPQAVLMATVINGILNRSLPWGLVLFGVFLVVMLELAGIRSLAFAVGAYLPIATSAPIFAGGCVRWMVERSLARKAAAGKPAAAGEGEVSSGALFASGLIAGGALAGLLLVAPMEAQRTAAGAAAVRAGEAVGLLPFDMGARWWPTLAQNDLFALALFAVLAAILFVAARTRLTT
ncbi:MAG TPA: oligopeptide transporter, OPT family [Longimicrobiales bacterium]|nr:oligopeptide transporter, OPT family [Longimicrobiales bacterium]